MVETKSIECNSIEYNSLESVECNSIETSNLNNQQLRLNEISEIEDYFIAEIKERELTSKKLSKYISFFDYSDKSLIDLSVTSGGVSIASFATVIGAPIGITSASLGSCIFIVYRTSKKVIKSDTKQEQEA